MTGFFLNQKPFCFFFCCCCCCCCLNHSRIRISFLSKGGNQTRSLLRLPCGRSWCHQPCRVPGHSCLCLPHLLVQIVQWGAASDWPKRLSLGFPVPALCVPLCFSSSKSVSVSQDGPVWLQTEVTMQPATSLGRAGHPLTAREQQGPLLRGGQR